MDVFTLPAGFTARHTAAGIVATREHVQLRCVARTCIAHPHALLAQLDPGARRSPARDVHAFDTQEGELALRTGDIVGDALARELALVVGDRDASLVVGIAPRANSAELFAIVDELACTAQLRLGIRRRRYRYTPPGGWQRFTLDGLDAHYLAPGHPRSPGCLTVHAALPGARPLDAWWCDAAPLGTGGATFDGSALLDEGLACAGLAGRRVRLAGHDGTRALLAELVCLADREYWYPIVLVTDASGARERLDALDDLVATIHPLARTPAAAAATDAFRHWCA